MVWLPVELWFAEFLFLVIFSGGIGALTGHTIAYLLGEIFGSGLIGSTIGGALGAAIGAPVSLILVAFTNALVESILINISWQRPLTGMSSAGAVAGTIVGLIGGLVLMIRGVRLKTRQRDVGSQGAALGAGFGTLICLPLIFIYMSS